jgi:hypothetical protein
MGDFQRIGLPEGTLQSTRKVTFVEKTGQKCNYFISEWGMAWVMVLMIPPQVITLVMVATLVIF